MRKLQLLQIKNSLEIKFLYETRKHPLVDKMLSGNPPQDIKQHINYLENVQEKTKWIYISYDDLAMVGYSQIYDLKEKTIEIGFAIHPDFQGKGYGKFLVSETIRKTKEKFSDKKIILYVLKNNEKAIHIYKKLGFAEKNLPGTNDTILGMELE